MPKLAKAMSAKAEAGKADWGDRAPLAAGFYLMRLRDVQVRDGKAAAQWVWEFEDVDTEKRVWDSTSLSEKAIGRLGKVFEGFGVPTNTDTDELIGQLVACRIGQRTIQDGEKKGAVTNTVESYHPAEEHPDHATFDGDRDGAGGGEAAADDDSDEFGLD